MADFETNDTAENRGKMNNMLKFLFPGTQVINVWQKYFYQL